MNEEAKPKTGLQDMVASKGIGRAWRALEFLSMSLPALAIGVLCCMALALLAGARPLEFLGAIWEGAWGSADAAATTISKTTPLLLNGLAVALAYQANLLNIGCEGQMRLGALAAASFSLFASGLPAFLLAPLTILTGAVVGGLWAYPAILLRRKRGVHEVISTLIMNYLAIYLADYLALGPLGDGTAMGRTPEMPAGAVWSPFWELGRMGVTAAPFVALGLSLLAQAWLSGTLWGFETRATGCNISAARAAGIQVDRWQTRLFVVSGAIAGLAGALEVAAVHHRFYRAFSPGYGFDGITAAFLVNGAPGGLWLSSSLLASLRAADKWLQLSLGISPNAILVIQAALLLAAACRIGFPSLRRRMRRAATEESASRAKAGDDARREADPPNPS